jgi:uncharacterized membrane protein YgcG
MTELIVAAAFLALIAGLAFVILRGGRRRRGQSGVAWMDGDGASSGSEGSWSAAVSDIDFGGGGGDFGGGGASGGWDGGDSGGDGGDSGGDGGDGGGD